MFCFVPVQYVGTLVLFFQPYSGSERKPQARMGKHGSVPIYAP